MKHLTVVFLFFVAASAVSAQPALRIRYYSGGQAWLSWTPVTGAASYSVERTSAYPSWSTQVTGYMSTIWSQSGLAANTTYIYRVVPRDGAGNPYGSPSNAAMVTSHAYADNPLDVDDPMALQHVLDLRAAIGSARVAAGAGSAVWTRTPLTGDLFLADEDINDLRSNLNAAFSNLGIPLPSYQDPNLTADVWISRVHIQQLRDLTRAYPEMVVVTGGYAMSELYFSPNGDSVKDTSTFTASVGFAAGAERVDFRWRVDVRSQTTSAVVRSAFGSGPAVAFVWDGRNGAGVIQPDALYAVELVDLDSLPGAIATAFTRLDTTPPTASITSPADAFVVSNIRQAGNGSVAVSGSAADESALQQWTLKQTGNAQTTVTINTGTTNLASGLLGAWQTLPSAGGLPNGNYVLELTVTDKAGNTGVDTVPVTVGHFSASRSAAQASAAGGGTVTYTSVIPYPLNLHLEIRRGSTLVRTLVNGTVQAVTRNDVWDLKDDQGQQVPDGEYRYYATVTDGSYSLNWDKSTSFPANPTATQFPYPKCWNGSAWIPCGSAGSSIDFDPYGGKPLRIAYCAGSGEPDTGCSGAEATLVVGKLTTEVETDDTCGAGCLLSGYQVGRQELRWYGLAETGTYYAADLPGLTIIRKSNSLPLNMTIVYGTAPVITNVTIAPMMFSPPAVPLPETGQTFTVSATSFNNRNINATASFYNMESGSLLRTITTPFQAPGNITLTWDGRASDAQATLVAPGRYAVTLTVSDEIGSKTTIRPVVVVRY